MPESSVPQRSVTIEESQRYCRSNRFYSAFPTELVGIIDRDEFFQSINNINHARKWTSCEKIVVFGSMLCPLIGLALFFVGLALRSLKKPALYIPLICIGPVLALAYIPVLIYAVDYVPESSLKRLKNAVDVESLKYSTKLPIPTKWRLDSYITRDDSDTEASIVIVHYQLIIDIGVEVSSAIGTDRSNPTGNLNEPSSCIV